MQWLHGSRAKSASLPLWSEKSLQPNILELGQKDGTVSQEWKTVTHGSKAGDTCRMWCSATLPSDQFGVGGRKSNLGARAAVGRGQNRLENRSTRTSWNLAGFRWCTRTKSQGGRGVGRPGWLCQLCSGGFQHCGGTDLSSPACPWIKDLLIPPDQVILQSQQIQYRLHISTYILQGNKIDLLFPINKSTTQISAQDCGCLKYSRWKSWIVKAFSQPSEILQGIFYIE